MATPTLADIRSTILDVIAEQFARYSGNLQSGSVLNDVAGRLQVYSPELQQAILTAFHDLFRTGYLAWGYDLANPSPPYFHVTEQGRRSLRDYSRDPANPDGYLANLLSCAQLPPIASSYVREALGCYVCDLPKGAAVMMGSASESLVIDLRDTIVERLIATSTPVPEKLSDGRVATVVKAIYTYLVSRKGVIPRPLWENVEAYWPAFMQQIRTVRNEAGLPSSIEPVTIDSVHASLLLFPELCKLWSSLKTLIAADGALSAQ
jgi:hypothetical protein